jgi:hypothetical protein
MHCKNTNTAVTAQFLHECSERSHWSTSITRSVSGRVVCERAASLQSELLAHTPLNSRGRAVQELLYNKHEVNEQSH